VFFEALSSEQRRFRRQKSIREEAIEANKLLKSGGSVRERFLAQQKKSYPIQLRIFLAQQNVV
jgi:hypothetical protein